MCLINNKTSKMSLKEFAKHLHDGNVEEVMNIVLKTDYNICKNSCLSELLPLVICNLNENTRNSSSDLFKCCEKLLYIFQERVQPEEYLLELIEQMETADNNVAFCTLLQLIQKVVFTIKDKRGFDWCLITIKRYLCKIPYDCNSKNDILDSELECQEINNLYFNVLNFIDPFVEEVKVGTNLTETQNKIRNIIICFLLQIMGVPFATLNFKINLNMENTSASIAKNMSRSVAENIMSLLSKIIPDKLCFLALSSDDKETNIDPLADTPEEEFVFNVESISLLPYSIFYYLLFSENIKGDDIPSIYNPIYIIQSCLHHAAFLLQEADSRIMRKGLLLSDSLMNIMPKNLTYMVLDSDVHRFFTIKLINIMVYSSEQEDRHFALKIFSRYFNNFDIKGQYLIIYHMRNVTNHAGVLGLLVMKYKSIIVAQLNKNDISKYAQNFYLKSILLKYIYLPEANKNDPMAMSDLYFSLLNILQYLLIRDKLNLTGIWNYVNDVKEILLIPLEESISLSEEYYKTKMKNLNSNTNNASEIKFNVETVNGDTLDALPSDKQIEVINCSLNGLHLLKDFVNRVLNIINDCHNT